MSDFLKSGDAFDLLNEAERSILKADLTELARLRREAEAIAASFVFKEAHR